MIEPIFTGRLGNMMFQIAAAYAYSLKHNMEYKAPLWGNGLIGANNNTDKHIRDEGQVSDVMLKYLNWFPNIKRGNGIAQFFDGAYLKHFPNKKDDPTKNGFIRYEENGRHEYNEIPFYPNIVIDGYFQSEKYFKDYRNEIVELFSLKKHDLKGWTSIHVRRGDYVQFYNSFPPVTEVYLRTAMKVAARNGFSKFMVFSDDIAWCKQTINPAKYPEYTFEYSEGKSEYEDLCLGASCSNNIISNSTFSWWQAWLNENPDKLVISPSKSNWFGKRVKLSTQDIIPDSWVQIAF